MNRELNQPDDVRTAAEELVRSGKAHRVVVSLGPQGALAVDKTGFVQVVPPPMKSQSTVGAGRQHGWRDGAETGAGRFSSGNGRVMASRRGVPPPLTRDASVFACRYAENRRLPVEKTDLFPFPSKGNYLSRQIWHIDYAKKTFRITTR